MKKDIMNLAGSWKMSDKEWGVIKEDLAKGWKKWKVLNLEEKGLVI